MEARIVRLETLAESTDRRLSGIEGDVREIRQDIKDSRRELSAAKTWVLILIGAAWMGMSGLLWTGYTRLDAKIEAQSEKIITKIDTQLGRVAERLPMVSPKP